MTLSHISLNNLLCYHPSTMCMIQEFYGRTTRFGPALNKCALMHGTGSPRAKLTSQPSSQHSVGFACVCQGPHGSTSCQNAIGFRRSCVARQTIKHRCKVLPAGPTTACRCRMLAVSSSVSIVFSISIISWAYTGDDGLAIPD
jgi:hypothetical protein